MDDILFWTQRAPLNEAVKKSKNDINPGPFYGCWNVAPPFPQGPRMDTTECKRKSLLIARVTLVALFYPFCNIKCFISNKHLD